MVGNGVLGRFVGDRVMRWWCWVGWALGGAVVCGLVLGRGFLPGEAESADAVEVEGTDS